MARKKQEIALQNIIETQEEWEEMLGKEGLSVIDVYQEWAGPCKAMVNIFKRIKNELGDDLLRFSVAKSDTVDALDRYRGRCEPCFLFFAGGTLVSVVRGANSPLLLRTITEQLAHEHKVLEGNAERKEVRDTQLSVLDAQKKDMEEDDEDVQEIKKDVTVAILKPNVVAEGKVDEVIEEMKERGIDILEKTERLLTEEEAREFYAHQADQEFFEDLISYMTSGPSVVLVISKGETGEGIVEEWRELIGPTSVEEAKHDAPESLRAKYGGSQDYVNGMHGSDGKDRAMIELAFFFPNYNVPTLVRRDAKKHRVQRTLALIRPDAMKEKKDVILAKIRESGFTIAMQKEMTLTKEQAEEFYKEHQGEAYFDELTTRMSSGPLLALALAREEAVTNWRQLLGPKELEKAQEEAPESFRAQFVVEESPINQLHGSDSPESANKELEFFFPMQQTVAVIKPDAYETKDQIMDKIKEAGFHIAARKETELTPEIAKQFYKDLADKEYFNELTDHMSAGPTLFMVLSREDAVDGWRSIIGPTDPEKAKEENPNSLRAQFGHDIKANAVHGSSTSQHAMENIKLMFGDMEFEPDGTVKGDVTSPSEPAQSPDQQLQEEQQQEQPPEQQEQQQEQKQEGGGSAAGSRSNSRASRRDEQQAGSARNSPAPAPSATEEGAGEAVAETEQSQPEETAATEEAEQTQEDQSASAEEGAASEQQEQPAEAETEQQQQEEQQEEAPAADQQEQEERAASAGQQEQQEEKEESAEPKEQQEQQEQKAE